jgi:hypothetical protein
MIATSAPYFDRSFAWTVNDQKELHSEYGFLAVSREKVALTTVMSNGFTTVEEGTINGQSVTLKLVDIGRISFSRDLPVHNVSPSSVHAQLVKGYGLCG